MSANSEVVACPRCGQDHGDMQFWQLKKPVCVSVSLVADIYAKGRPQSRLKRLWRRLILALVKRTLPECLPIVNGGMTIAYWSLCPISHDPILMMRMDQPAFDRIM
jgi:hypothetical protein